MGVKVDEPRRKRQPIQVDRLLGVLCDVSLAVDRNNSTVFDSDSSIEPRCAGPINDSAVSQ